jgi:hypothetical protein
MFESFEARFFSFAMLSWQKQAETVDRSSTTIQNRTPTGTLVTLAGRAALLDVVDMMSSAASAATAVVVCEAPQHSRHFPRIAGLIAVKQQRHRRPVPCICKLTSQYTFSLLRSAHAA